MKFKGTPRDLAYTGARSLVVFLVAAAAIFFTHYTWIVFTVDLSEIEDATLAHRLRLLPYGWIFYLVHSPVLPALGSSFLGWMIAFPGIFLANGAQRLAAFIFGFATLMTAAGLRTEYWYAALPTMLVLAWLTAWAWSLRNVIEVVELGAAEVENAMLRHRALHEREIRQEELISRR